MFRPITQTTPAFNQQRSQLSKKVALFLYRRKVLSWTNAMALTNRSNFHMLSVAEFDAFFSGIFRTDQQYALFDIGAGNGSVTQNLTPLFNLTWVNEPAQLMRWRLKRNMPHLNHSAIKTLPPIGNLIISLFNVLDIANNPNALIEQILTLDPQFIIISLPSETALNQSKLGTLLRWSKLNYYDLDDGDYLDCFIAIYQPH